MASADKIRFMSLSDSATTVTGFAHQTKFLCKTLAKNPDFDVTSINWNIVTEPISKLVFEDGEELNYRILGGGKTQYAADILPEYFMRYRPHIFFVLLDSFMLHPWIYNMDFAPAKSILWYPSDGEYFPVSCENILRKFTHPVAMSKFAQNQLQTQYGVHSDYIPHGIDTDKFYPLPPERKAEIRARLGIPEDAFVVLNVGRNQGRKNMGATINVFKEFAKDKEDVYLVLHTDMQDPAAPCDLGNLIMRNKIERKVRSTGMKFFLGPSDDAMNEIFNVADIHFSTTTGEGFGLCTVESMACEVPVALTSYTTTPEILDYPQPANWCEGDFIKAKGLGIPTSTEIVGSWNVNRGFISEPKAVAALNYAYSNRQEMREMGKRARQHVVSNYDLNRVVGPSWIKKIKQVVA